MLTAITTITAVNAQSLQLAANGNYIENHSEMYYIGTPNPWGVLKVYFWLKNMSNIDLQIEGSYTVIEEPVGTITSWCAFGNCWGTPVMSPAPLKANATEGLDSLFYFEIELNTQFEPATFELNFNVAGHSTDKVSATIHFIDRKHIPKDLPFETGHLQNDTLIFIKGGMVTSNRRLTAETPTINTYPNPTIDNITFELDKERGRIEIYSATGRIVRKIQATSSVVSIDLTGLSAGIYFYTFENAAGKKTGKFIKL